MKNSNCPACAAKRIHTPEEWRDYHPEAGHGYAPEMGWTVETPSTK